MIWCAYTAFLFYSIYAGDSSLTLISLATPFFLIAGFLVVFRPDVLVCVLVFVVPLSVNVELPWNGIAVSIPAEMIIFILVVGIVLDWAVRRHPLKNTRDRQFLRHPVSVAVCIYLMWSVLTALTSELSLISAKYVFVQFCFLLVFYWYFTRVFDSPGKIRFFFGVFTFSMAGTIVYTLYRHGQYNFVQIVNNQMPEPFFNDHTIYGACMAMLLPLLVEQLLNIRYFKNWLAWLYLPLFLTGLLFTYSRGAWLSLVVMMAFTVFIVFRIRLSSLAILIVTLVFIGIWQHHNIVDTLDQVKSQPGSDLKENALSTFNISTSITNVERINRWNAGIGMVLERPVTGFGPGTYPFQYGSYQDERLMTDISTRLGDRGGAHSEYIQSLAEMGLPGGVLFIVIIFLTIRTALNLAYNAQEREVRILAATMLLGLITYYTHSLVNNFLHTDKIAALFWGMTGFVVMLDVRDKRKVDP